MRALVNYNNVESSNIARTTIMPIIQFITLAFRESFPSLNNQPTAQIIFTHWLSKRGSNTRITANCIRVPAVRVNIDKYPGLSVMQKKAYELKSKFSLSPEQMANAYTFLATAAEMEGVTGLYYNEKMKPVKPPRYTEQSQNINKVMELTMSYLRR